MHIDDLRKTLLSHKKYGNKMSQYLLVAKECAEAAYDPTKNTTASSSTSSKETEKKFNKIEDALKRFADIDPLSLSIYGQLLENLRKRVAANDPKATTILDLDSGNVKTPCIHLEQGFALLVILLMMTMRALLWRWWS